MRDFLDVLIAAAGISVGWWASDFHRRVRPQRESGLLPYPVAEPPSNVVLEIVDDDGDGLLA